METSNLLDMLKKFLPVAVKELQLQSLPKMVPVTGLTDGDHPSFGRYVPDTNSIEFAIEDRHPIDILRTLAHELVHCKQREDNRLKHDSGETGSDEENEANARAGIIMRNFDDAYPDYFSEEPLQLAELDDKQKPKSWDDYGMQKQVEKKPEEKVFQGWKHYDDEQAVAKEKQKQLSEDDYVSSNVSYHDSLNPIAWDGTEMKQEVRLKLLEIAKVFIEYLEIPNFELTDIVLTGSLTNFNYTKYSDFDIHVVTNYKSLQCDDLAEALYRAKKHIWNEAHDITIRGHEAELYVEDVNEPPVSAGVFSLLDNKWLKEPDYNKPEIDNSAINAKVKGLIKQIDSAIESADDPSDIKRVTDKIRKMRRSGLDQHGEFGTENLAFKILRNLGYLDKLNKAYLGQ